MARPRARGLLVAALAIGSAAALALPALALGARVGQGPSQQSAPADLRLTLATGQVESFGVNLNFQRGAPQTRGGSAVFPLSFGGSGVVGSSGVIGSAILAGTGQIELNRSRSEASLQLQQLNVLFPEVPGAGNAAPAQAGGTPPARTTLTAPVQLSTETVDNWPFNGPQPVPKLRLADVYRCYQVTRVNGRASTGRVGLRDQFGNATVAFGGPSEVCNPVAQAGRKARNRIRHLVAYRILGPQQPARDAGVRYQFGPAWQPRATAARAAQVLTTGALTDLLVPSAKQLRSGSRLGVPGALGSRGSAHFACYRATALRPLRGPRLRATLIDQFRSRLARLAPAHAVCNPTAKSHAGGATPMGDPRAHLTSFSLLNRRSIPPRKVRITNQFGARTVTTGFATRILAPTVKRRCARFRARGLNIPIVSTKNGRTIAGVAAIELTPRGGRNGACPFL